MQQIWKYISAIFIDAHRACQFQTRCDSKEMGRDVRKSVIGVSNKASFKPVSSATETSQKIEISPVAS